LLIGLAGSLGRGAPRLTRLQGHRRSLLLRQELSQQVTGGRTKGGIALQGAPQGIGQADEGTTDRRKRIWHNTGRGNPFPRGQSGPLRRSGQVIAAPSGERFTARNGSPAQKETGAGA